MLCHNFDFSCHNFKCLPVEKTIEPLQKKVLMVSITNTITNHQLLTIFFFFSVLGHISLGFIGFNKPPIEGDQVETHRVHYSFH